jgi:hypothetical protein
MDHTLKEKRATELRLLKELVDFEMKTGAMVKQIFITRNAERVLADLRIGDWLNPKEVKLRDKT